MLCTRSVAKSRCCLRHHLQPRSIQGRCRQWFRQAWWGQNLPLNRGRHNFDTLRYEYYRDREIAFEGFTAKNYLFREEFTSRTWATRYDFPAVRDGRVQREELPDNTPSGAQGWFINTRRNQFKNPMVREALIYAFDFEWSNKNIMYGMVLDRSQYLPLSSKRRRARSTKKFRALGLLFLSKSDPVNFASIVAAV